MCRLFCLWLILMPFGFAGAAMPSGEIRVDLEEWRDQPVRHFYIHGTWNGASTRYHRQIRESPGAAPTITSASTSSNTACMAAFVDAPFRSVSNGAASRKALEDVRAWVKTGAAPPPSTQYGLDKMNQLVLPSSAAERKGWQPVVRVSAGGGEGRVRTTNWPVWRWISRGTASTRKRRL